MNVYSNSIGNCILFMLEIDGKYEEVNHAKRCQNSTSKM